MTLSLVQETLQEIKHREKISRSTSNNRSQAQELNILDVLVRSPSRNAQAQSKISLLSVTLVCL